MRRLLAGRGTPAIAVGILALLIAGGGYALASGGGTIHACIHKGDGTLYVRSKCHKKDKTISWNQAGPQGPKGATGAAGPAGAKGASNAIAGARVTPAGAVTDWFNNFSTTAPTITHTAASGVYDIVFPSAPITAANTILLATPDTPSVNCTATNADYASSGTQTIVVVETKDCQTNTFADRGFHLVVFGDHTLG